MERLSTGFTVVDRRLEGGLPDDGLISIYSPAGVAMRRRLLCCIAEANSSVFVDCASNSMVPKSTPRLSVVDALDGLTSALKYKARVVVIDPVVFEQEQNDSRFRKIELLMELCRSSDRTVVLGWTNDRMPIRARYDSTLIIRLPNEQISSLIIQKNKHGPSDEQEIRHDVSPRLNRFDMLDD